MTPLTDEERQALGTIAWRAVASAARGERGGVRTSWPVPHGAPAGPSPAPSPLLDRRGGAFVSLHRGGDLRGCIGHLDDDVPVVTIVDAMAVAAATADPRFAPLSANELDGLHVEISLLGPLVPIEGPNDLEIGRDGVLVRDSGRTGVLLPQVASSWGFDRREFVAQVCRKAGLAADAWTSGAQLYRFEAEVFDAVRPAVLG